MNTKSLTALYELGKSLVLQGNHKAADEKFQLIIDQVMTSKSGYRDLLYKAYKARLDINTDPTTRNHLSATLIELFGDDPKYAITVLWDLAQYHKVNGDSVRYIDALTLLQQRHPKNPHSTDIALELGLSYHLENKDIREAIKHYTQYLNEVGTKHTNTEMTAINLASCYNATRQPQRAQMILKKYLNIG